MSRRILVLDADAPAALTIAQSLGRAGYEVSIGGTSEDDRAFASRYCRRALVYPNPLIARDEFVAWMIATQAAEQFALIIPPTERTMAPLHHHRDELGDALAIPPAEAFEVGIDKERVRQLADELGIPTPENLTVSDPGELEDPRLDAWLADGAVVYKSVLSKSWDGSFAREHTVEMATSREALSRLAEGMHPGDAVQLQRWVPGRGVGVELLADRGEIVLHFAHERIHELPLTGGGSSYRRSVPTPPRLLDDAARLVKRLGWHGVAMVEFRQDGDRYWMMELNGRFWGSLALAQFAGVDFPLALARLLLDGERPVQPEARRVYARQLRRDVDWLRAMTRVRFQDLRRRGRPAPPERALVLERPVAQSALEWVRVLGGRETWDGAALDDPRPIVREAMALVGGEVERVVRSLSSSLLRRAAVRAWQRPIAARRVLVLCTGNICRSVYVEQRLRALAPSLEVRSAAIEGASGRPSPSGFRAVALEHGVDLRDHLSTRATDELMDWADLVLVMEQRHARALAQRWPRVVEKSRWLGAILGGDPEIADPYSMSAEDSRVVLRRMDEASARLAARLTGG